MSPHETIGGRRALLIASGSYTDPGLKRLRSPIGDVCRLGAVLGNPAIGAFGVRKVVDRPTDEILRAIEQFFADGRRNEVLLLYISGHGVIAKDGGLYFATASTDLTFLRSTAIADSFVASSMRHCRSRSIVLILDCCHSGAFTKGLTPKSALQVNFEHRFEGSGHVTLTASSALEYAFEEEFVEDLGAAKAGSLFTHFAVEGLSTGEADIDDDGDISVDELYSYVYEQVQAVAPQQRPGKSGTGHGEVLIARSARSASLRSELRQPLRSPLVGVRLAAVAELARRWTERAEDADAVHAALRALVDDDDSAVARAARAALTDRKTSPPGAPATDAVRDVLSDASAGTEPDRRRANAGTPVTSAAGESGETDTHIDDLNETENVRQRRRRAREALVGRRQR
jgi:hypothetical protein